MINFGYLEQLESMKIKYSRVRSNLSFKLLGIFAASFLCVYPAFALLITEVSFDPSGSDTDREWIEIYNDQTTNIDLTSVKFFENEVNHGVSVLSGDKLIQPGEFVVLVQDLNKFKTDFPNYTGKIFKSSFSLSNSGETISLKDGDGPVLHLVNYKQVDTGAKDGETISLSGQAWVKTIANPGSSSYEVTSSGNGTTTDTTVSTTTSTTTNETYFVPTYSYRSYYPESEKVYVFSGENRTGISGAEVHFEARAVNGEKKTLNDATYFWNFGDGETSQGKSVKHVFKYPSEYVVNVEAYSGGNKGDDKIYIKIVDPKIDVSFYDVVRNDLKETVVEIKNNNLVELDLGGLVVKSQSFEHGYVGEFRIPRKTLILPKKSITMDGTTLKLATSTDRISIGHENGRVISKSYLDKVNPGLSNPKPKVTTQGTSTSTWVKVSTLEDYNRQLKNQVNSSTTEVRQRNLSLYKSPQINKDYSEPPTPIKDNESTTTEMTSKQERVFVVEKKNKTLWEDLMGIFK